MAAIYSGMGFFVAIYAIRLHGGNVSRELIDLVMENVRHLPEET